MFAFRALTFALALLLSTVAPAASTTLIVPIIKKYADDLALTLSGLFLPLAFPADNGLGDALAQGEMFINGLLVLNSEVGLVQTTASVNHRAGIAYDTRSYLRVSTSAPSAPRFIRGLAVSPDGAMYVYDASAGLPANVIWQGGLPMTPSGQLCVAFA